MSRPASGNGESKQLGATRPALPLADPGRMTSPRSFPPPLLITSREATRSTHSRRHRVFGDAGVHMRSNPLTNERTYPYFVDIPVAAVGLDVALSHQIMKFHKSRQLQLRHGRTNSRGGENYYRWCFADLMTALAFVEQFGGAFTSLEQIADAG